MKKRTLILFFLILLIILNFIPYPFSIASASPDDPPVNLYVISHGYHTAFIIHHDDAKLLRNLFPGWSSGYLHIAWGDSAFFSAPGFPVGKGIKALFTNTPSVLHVYFFENQPREQFPSLKIKEVTAPADKFHDLENFLFLSFKLTPGSEPRFVSDGKYSRSAFYESNKIYNLIYNCNNWVAQGLHLAGQRTAFWAPLPFMVMMYL